MSERIGTSSAGLSASPNARPRRLYLSYALMVAAAVFAAVSIQKDRFVTPTRPQARSSAPWGQVWSSLPLSFEVNRGQTDQQVNFLARGHGYTLFLTPQEAVLSLKKSEVRSQKSGGTAQASIDSTAVVRMGLVGANPAATAVGSEQLPGRSNYYIGNDPRQWRTDVPTYAKVKYPSVYPGIDLVYYGNQGGQLEYDFVVAPGTDPSAIALNVGAGLVPAQGRLQGAPLRITPDGDLVIPAGEAELSFHKPVVYQPAPANEPRTPVDGKYVLRAGNQVGFTVGPYDHSRPLVIDPALSYATYLGGTGGDVAYAIAVDSNNDAYIAGSTSSANFPTSKSSNNNTTVAAAFGTNAGNGDAFVSKISANGGTLMYSTYLGGSGSDTAAAIAVGATSNNAYVTGNTNSTNFPNTDPSITANPPVPTFQTTYGGGTSDAFVTEISTGTGKLVYSSYLGGNGADFGQGIAVDSVGNAYVTGSTQSSSIFPVTSDAVQAANKGNGDAFITVVNTTGTAVLYSTYFGGSQADVAQAIQVTTSGTSPQPITANVYISGYTFSTSTDFPLAGTPFQATNAGAPDGFVAEVTISNLGISGQASAKTFSTFLGGTGDDRAWGLAVDVSGNVYVAGATTSTDFPTHTAYQGSNNGNSDAFITELEPTGSALVYSTYLGGEGADQANAIAVDSNGNAFVTGYTQSQHLTLVNALQTSLGNSAPQVPLCGSANCSDAFVAKLAAGGATAEYVTYLGGSGPDFAQGIAVDSSGLAYVTGSTSSTNFPAIAGAFQSSLNGIIGNAFVAKVDTITNQPTIAIVPGSVNFGSETLSVQSAQQQITIVNPSTEALDITAIAFNSPTNVSAPSTSTKGFTETNNCLGTISAAATCTINVTFTPNATGQVTDELTITDTAYIAGNQSTSQTITFTGTGTTGAGGVTVTPTSLTFPNQTIATTSAAQAVTIQNTGTVTVNIKSISTGTSDFHETDTCFGSLQGTLTPGQSCTVSVTFTPSASGTRGGTLTISDTAVAQTQTVALSGVGLAEFSLSQGVNNPNNKNPVLIGATSTTFVIVANGPNTFTGTITLGCPGLTVVTCSFNPATVGVGASSTLTLSNLSTTLVTPGNPFAFTVVGSSGTESASLQLNLLFEDFTLSAAPPIKIIPAGSAAQYTVLVNPLNGLTGQQINLTCDSTGLPPASTCTFSNATPSPSGSASSVQLTIQTQKYVAPTLTPPRVSDKLPPIILGILSLGALLTLGLSARRRVNRGLAVPRWLCARLAALSLILTLNLALGSCRPSVLVVSGTTTGNYSITVRGTLNSNTAVQRTVPINLSVTQ